MRSSLVYRISLALLAISIGALLAGSSQFTNFKLYFAKTFNRSLSYHAAKHEKLRLRAYPGQTVAWNIEVASSLQSQWAASQGLTLLMMNPNTGYQSAYTLGTRAQNWGSQIPPVDTSSSPTDPVIVSGMIQIPSDFAAQTLEGRLVGSIAYPVPAVPPPSFLTTDRSVTIYEDVTVAAELEVIPYTQHAATMMMVGIAGLLGTIIFGTPLVFRFVRANIARWRVALAEKAIVTFVNAVAPLTQPNPKAARRQLAEGTLKTSFERVHAESEKKVSVSLERQNFERLRYSGLLESWVRANKGIWSHQDWLELLNLLKSSEFWPVEPNAVGAALEEIKKDYDEMPQTTFPVEQPVALDSALMYSASV